MTTTTTQVFSEADAFALLVAGYEYEYCAESWEDVGGPESGPKLVGGPSAHVYVHYKHKHVVIAEEYDNTVLCCEVDHWVGYEPDADPTHLMF